MRKKSHGMPCQLQLPSRLKAHLATVLRCIAATSPLFTPCSSLAGLNSPHGLFNPSHYYYYFYYLAIGPSLPSPKATWTAMLFGTKESYRLTSLFADVQDETGCVQVDSLARCHASLQSHRHLLCWRLEGGNSGPSGEWYRRRRARQCLRTQLIGHVSVAFNLPVAGRAVPRRNLFARRANGCLLRVTRGQRWVGAAPDGSPLSEWRTQQARKGSRGAVLPLSRHRDLLTRERDYLQRGEAARGMAGGCSGPGCMGRGCRQRDAANQRRRRHACRAVLVLAPGIARISERGAPRSSARVRSYHGLPCQPTPAFPVCR
eukprot:365661-Chlamydomonas_euryale.AAC.56